MLYLCEIPSSSWNEFMNDRQDEIVVMPSWEEWLHEQGFSWMTAIWQQMLAETFPSMALWPWKTQMKFFINFCHYQRRVRQSAKYHFVEFFAGNGNLSRELLRDGWEGVAVDIKYGTDHNLLSVRGLRLAINAVLETHSGGLLWFGTPCSSFVKICKTLHPYVHVHFGIRWTVLEILFCFKALSSVCSCTVKDLRFLQALLSERKLSW